MKTINNRYGYHSEMNYIIVYMSEYPDKIEFYYDGRISYPDKRYPHTIGVWKLTKK